VFLKRFAKQFEFFPKAVQAFVIFASPQPLRSSLMFNQASLINSHWHANHLKTWARISEF